MQNKRKEDLDFQDVEFRRRSILCCCQYRQGGKVKHLCDCSDLDEGCMHLGTCTPMPTEVKENFIKALTEKLRCPFPGGSIAVPLSLLPPLMIVPYLHAFASLNFCTAILVNCQ